ncbi:hypothetical protein MPTK1_5g06610 [Marchantia polymorpha subsp. ruderalis]|uniref:Uncharacterized protein n=2 Tax=Marchantia polymorpha TaxID=3197 RepID=A0AAF6BFM8_MARPO|nr:hypothetical protein MARPO_0171s0022 [Marchantia polymorpha]BBN10812.1 hypothetical protein Mp_5g06610 [Marchantia polymorpha subsp. ruderalis]|eukprot:PTQ28180.1 hypothetical protein MARPO_0171s0022 [Marchantia polymorpha]
MHSSDAVNNEAPEADGMQGSFWCCWAQKTCGVVEMLIFQHSRPFPLISHADNPSLDLQRRYSQQVEALPTLRAPCPKSMTRCEYPLLPSPLLSWPHECRLWAPRVPARVLVSRTSSHTPSPDVHDPPRCGFVLPSSQVLENFCFSLVGLPILRSDDDLVTRKPKESHGKVSTKQSNEIYLSHHTHILFR